MRFKARKPKSPSRLSSDCACVHEGQRPEHRHTPLTFADREIRLLQLHPAAGLDAPLCGSLITQDTTVRQGGYEALSYTWSGDESPNPLTIDGTRLAIRGNLRDALRRIRLVDRVRVLWIDAVCIDQSNDTEKTVQVGRMDSVYAKADQTIIWLGEEPDEGVGSVFFRMIKVVSVVKTMPRSGQLLEWLYREAVQLFRPKADRNIALDFIRLVDRRKRPRREISFPTWGFWQQKWFSRRWVIQEALLSPRAIVKYGPAEMDRRVCAKFFEEDSKIDWLSWRGRWIALLAGAQNHGVGLLTGHVAMVDNGRDFQTSAQGLLQHLKQFRDYECGDPRDRIAALLGLHPAVKESFSIDYSLSVEDNNVRFAKVLMTKGLCRQILFHAAASLRKPASWIPDWRERPEKSPSLIFINNSPFNAEVSSLPQSFEPVFSTALDGRLLVTVPFIRMGIVTTLNRPDATYRPVIEKDAEFETDSGIQGEEFSIMSFEGRSERWPLVQIGDLICLVGTDVKAALHTYVESSSLDDMDHYFFVLRTLENVVGDKSKPESVLYRLVGVSPAFNRRAPWFAESMKSIIQAKPVSEWLTLA